MGLATLTLEQELRDLTLGAPSLHTKRASLRGVAQGMAAVHAHRIIHLDLKPQNVRFKPAPPNTRVFLTIMYPTRCVTRLLRC